MSQTKRVSGVYTIAASGGTTVDSELTITGNLTVTGTTNSVETTNSRISDNIVTYNQGETGSGVTAGGGKAGIEIERGSLANALLVFDESDDTFKVSTNGGSSFSSLATGAMSNVVEDTTPQLGGDLDINGKNIVSATSNMDIQLVPNGTGVVTVASALKLTDQLSAPSSHTSATLLYADTAAGGGTGVFFVDGTNSDELVSKSKAIVYGLIF
tara:strand:- start:296 stop:934 length:639 start_codon:yes stop_codon:yes gene_type:complete